MSFPYSTGLFIISHTILPCYLSALLFLCFQHKCASNNGSSSSHPGPLDPLCPQAGMLFLRHSHDSVPHSFLSLLTCHIFCEAFLHPSQMSGPFPRPILYSSLNDHHYLLCNLLIMIWFTVLFLCHLFSIVVVSFLFCFSLSPLSRTGTGI